jgi:hypothetical protein
MSEISRRFLLTGAATAPLFAQQTAQTTAAPRDVIPQRHLLSSRCTADRCKEPRGSRSLESLSRGRRSRCMGALAADDRTPSSKKAKRSSANRMSRSPPRSFSSTHATATAPAGKPCSSDAAHTCEQPYWRSAWKARALPRRHRRRHLGHLRGELLGCPAHMGAQKRSGTARCAGADHRTLLCRNRALLAWTHYLFGKQRQGASADPRAAGKRNRPPPAQRLSQPAGLRLDGPEQLCAGE